MVSICEMLSRDISGREEALGLLRMHAGDGSIESVTVHLGAAREVSEAIGRLISGQEGVERSPGAGSGK